MNTINYVLGRATDWLLNPLADWPLLTLLLVSAVTGVLMAVVFRYTSNQPALIRVGDHSKGHLLAIKLFKDDLRGIFTSLGQVLRNACLRVGYSIVPLLVMIVPLILLLTQLALRYEYRPLVVGEPAVVQLTLQEDAWPALQNIKLEAPPAVAVETDAVRDESEHSIYWRIRPTGAVRGSLGWAIGGERVEKQIAATEEVRDLLPVSARRPSAKWWDRVLYPGEPGFDEFFPVESIVIHYAKRTNTVLGFSVPWWLTFFVVSIVAALLMQPIVKVKF